jgi:branched-subunit amino acid ABC-type transport system permease component
LIAALVLSTITTFTAYWAGGNWSQAAVFVVLMLFRAVRPGGIFGRTEIVRA